MGFSIRRVSDDSFIGGISEELKIKACTLIRGELEDIRQKMKEDLFDLYVLDELITAVYLGILPEKDVFSLMEARPDSAELVLTGRGASKRLIEHADLVSDIRSIKHPYQNGIPSRRGIEY
jgi:cob(I)alamin adenosyltransferase